MFIGICAMEASMEAMEASAQNEQIAAKKLAKKCEFRIFFGFCFRSGSNLAEVDEVDAGLACELVHKEKHADASSVRRSLYLSERVFYVFV